MCWKLVLAALPCDRPRQWVTCGSPSGTGMVLDGSGVADGWFHQTPLGRGLSLSVHFFGKLSLPYDSYVSEDAEPVTKAETQQPGQKQNYLKHCGSASQNTKTSNDCCSEFENCT